MAHFLTCINLTRDRSLNWELCKQSSLLGIANRVAHEALRSVSPGDVIYVWKTGGPRHGGGLLARPQALSKPRLMNGSEPWEDRRLYGCTIPFTLTHEANAPVFDSFPDNGPNRLGIENGWVTRSWAAIQSHATVTAIETELRTSIAG